MYNLKQLACNMPIFLGSVEYPRKFKYRMKKRFSLHLTEIHLKNSARLDNNGLSRALRYSDVEKLIEESKKNTELTEGIFSFINKSSFNRIETIQIGDYVMGIDLYDIIEIDQPFFKFDGCKDYFIISVSSLGEMTALINEAREKGYYLIERDVLNKTVEMRKNIKGIK